MLQGRKAIGVKWVNQTKRDANREVQRYKDRLVIEDHKEEESIEHGEVFALVPN